MTDRIALTLDPQAFHILNGDAEGNPTGFTKSQAPVCFCSLGALTRAMWDRIEVVNKLVSADTQDEVYEQYSVQYDIVYDYMSSLAGQDLVDFNDSLNTHHSDIVNLFDLAIDNAEERVYE
jgi:hypothetical protein